MSASNAGEKNVRWVNALLAPYLDRRFGGMDKRHREYAYRTFLTFLQLNWPTLGRGEAHPGPFRAG